MPTATASLSAGLKILDACPCCGGRELKEPLPKTLRYDNGLESWIRSGLLLQIGDAPARDFARVEWRVCTDCTLIFCLKRPSLEKAESWYGELFRSVERRNYDVTPLPREYLENQISFAREFAATLNTAGVLNDVGSVLHLRCNAGYILKEVLQLRPGIEAYGIEYFDAPAAHAATLLGEDLVRVIKMPEPRNPFGRSSFDLILAEHYLTHAHNPVEYLDYLVSLLSPRGKLVIFNEQDHELTMRRRQHYRRGINFFHKQLFTPRTLHDFLCSRDLAVSELPHPRGRKWAVSNHSLLFVCQTGHSNPLAPGSSQDAVALMQGWLALHRRQRRIDALLHPLASLKRLVSWTR
jgi:hypothetical protein